MICSRGAGGASFRSVVDGLDVQARVTLVPVSQRVGVLMDLLVHFVPVGPMVGQSGVEADSRDAGLFEDSLVAHLLVAGDDLPHVEPRAWHPCAAATLRPTEGYAGVPLGPKHLFGGPPEMLVLGDVQDDADTFSALVRKVACFP